MRLAPLLLLLLTINVVGQDVEGLKFVQNKGQWDRNIDFQALVPGGRVGVSATGFSIVLLDMEELERRHMENHGVVNESDGHTANEPVNGHYFQINLVGANPLSRPIAEAPLDGHYNYFIGNDTSRWA